MGRVGNKGFITYVACAYGLQTYQGPSRLKTRIYRMIYPENDTIDGYLIIRDINEWQSHQSFLIFVAV